MSNVSLPSVLVSTNQRGWGGGVELRDDDGKGKDYKKLEDVMDKIKENIAQTNNSI